MVICMRINKQKTHYKTCVFYLEFSSITLHEYTDKSRRTTTRKEIRKHLLHQPIISPKSRNRNSVKYDVMYTKTSDAEGENKDGEMFSYHDVNICKTVSIYPPIGLILFEQF